MYKQKNMKKYCIKAVLKSSKVSNGKEMDECVLAFSADNSVKPFYHGNVIILNCKSFNLDEANSSKNWRDAFGFNLEPPQGALITVNLGYKAGEIKLF